MNLSIVIPSTRATGFLENQLKDYEVLIQRENGLVTARNAGWKKAKGDVIAFIDDDVMLSKQWADEITSPFKDPSVGCVMGSVLLLGKENRDNDWSNPVMKNFLRRIGNTQACNMAFSRKALIKAEGFDYKFDSGVGEWSEPDLVNRVKALGFKVVYNDKAKLIHCPSQEGIYKDRAKYSYLRMSNFNLFRRRWLKWDLNLLAVVAIFYLYWLYKFIKTGNKDWLGGLRAL